MGGGQDCGRIEGGALQAEETQMPRQEVVKGTGNSRECEQLSLGSKTVQRLLRSDQERT